MMQNLDHLMEENQIDAILVTGPAQHNPPMMYMTGGAQITHADLVKRKGLKPVLIHSPMERDEAAKTGLETKNVAEYNLNELLKQANGDFTQATILRYQRMLTELGLTSGRIALYGKIDAGAAFAIFTGLQQLMPDLTIVGELSDSLILQAMATKNKQEVERIRRMGEITKSVVGEVAEFLTSHKTQDGVLMNSRGDPLTIGEVKRRINLWLAEREAENPEGTIFAIARDAGVPHSSGNPEDVVQLGQTIVFDIFPCEAGGGYFYDFTRTWCLGYAPDDVQAIYQDVYTIYRQIVSELKVDTLCQEYQNRACDLFEERGYPTIRSNPQTQEGYVHTLGHGIGLHVHERPWFGRNATEADRLSPGAVVTIEPGLYFPEKGIGVRLEDTIWVRPDGQMEVLAEFPMDLVLPMKNA